MKADKTEFFLNLIKFQISNVKLQCQLDFIVMNFVEQFKLNRTREYKRWNLQLWLKGRIGKKIFFRVGY